MPLGPEDDYIPDTGEHPVITSAELKAIKIVEDPASQERIAALQTIRQTAGIRFGSILYMHTAIALVFGIEAADQVDWERFETQDRDINRDWQSTQPFGFRFQDRLIQADIQLSYPHPDTETGEIYSPFMHTYPYIGQGEEGFSLDHVIAAGLPYLGMRREFFDLLTQQVVAQFTLQTKPNEEELNIQLGTIMQQIYRKFGWAQDLDGMKRQKLETPENYPLASATPAVVAHYLASFANHGENPTPFIPLGKTAGLGIGLTIEMLEKSRLPMEFQTARRARSEQTILQTHSNRIILGVGATPFARVLQSNRIFPTTNRQEKNMTDHVELAASGILSRKHKI